MGKTTNLYHSSAVRRLDEIAWEKKENRRRRFRRVGLICLYTLILLSLVIW